MDYTNLIEPVETISTRADAAQEAADMLAEHILGNGGTAFDVTRAIHRKGREDDGVTSYQRLNDALKASGWGLTQRGAKVYAVKLSDKELAKRAEAGERLRASRV